MTAPADGPKVVPEPAQTTVVPSAPGRFATTVLRSALASLASLELTVWLLSLAIVLVLAGTLAQVDEGIWTVVGKYFRCFVARIPFQVFFPRSVEVPGSILFPGGWLLGAGLLLNLIAAHVTRFKWSGRRAGIILTHFGLIVLLLGELVTGLFAIEGNMTIDEGGACNYVEQARVAELAFEDPADPAVEDVVVVPERFLQSGAPITHADLPFDLRPVRWLANSRLVNAGTQQNPATAGAGVAHLAVEGGGAAGTDPDQTLDMPSAYVVLIDKASGRELGTWLFSFWLNPQEIELGGRTWKVALRHRRIYKPYTLHLIDFKHERYLGTDIPKNFSSQVRLVDPEMKVDREVLIYMNHPLRYRGETFFQASFKPDDSGTVLQVVRNPGWLLPYVSCTLVGLGLTLHFGLSLTAFLRRKAA